MFAMIGYEWLLVLGVALLLFGSQLPKMARGAGRGLRGAKAAIDEVKADLAIDPSAPAPAAPRAAEPDTAARPGAPS